MDFYTVIILIPSTGNRIIIDNAQVTVDMKTDRNVVRSASGYEMQMPGSNWLEMEIKILNPEPSIYSTVKDQLFNEMVYIHFKDTHPNLIRSSITDIAMMHDNVTLSFKGNATNKTYHDFITEVTDQLNAYQFHFQSDTNDHSVEPMVSTTQPKPKPKKKVTKVIKRKLTFD